MHSCIPSKPYPNSDLNRQSLNPSSDQNGAKTISFWAEITYKAFLRDYPPPPHPVVYTNCSVALGLYCGSVLHTDQFTRLKV